MWPPLDLGPSQHAGGSVLHRGSPACASRPCEECTRVCQRFCLQGASQLSPTSPANASRHKQAHLPHIQSGHLFSRKTTICSPGVSASETTHDPSKRGFLASFSTLGPLNISSTGVFQARHFGGSLLWYKSQGLGCPYGAQAPRSSRRSACLVASSLLCACTRGGVL